MPQENYQKIKLLKIMEILRQETDEEHPMTKVELAARLVAMNVSCSPRSLIRDIKLLNEQGYEIMERLIGHEKAYFVCDRSFSVPELKILIDAVQAASFVTNKKTGELIDKIAALGGSHRAAILKGNMVKFNARKHRNETVYYTVGYLEDAIKQNRKVAFKYFDVTETGQRAFRRDGAEYVMEPVALVFNEDNYYLITYNEKHEATTNYRVDRIDSVRILDDPISETARSLRRKVARYTEEAFKMFNGQQETVTLRFADKLIGPVLDKFGEDTKMTRVDDHTIEATVQVRIAPTFWGWLTQFAGDMTITEPETAIKEYKEHLLKELTMLGDIRQRNPHRPTRPDRDHKASQPDLHSSGLFFNLRLPRAEEAIKQRRPMPVHFHLPHIRNGEDCKRKARILYSPAEPRAEPIWHRV